MKTLLIAMLVGGAATVAGITGAGSGKKVVVGRAVAADQQISMDQINHETWNTLLQRYVNEKGEVNYRAWQSSREDSQALDEYLNHLSTASLQTNATRAAQLAYWINAYNAVTVKGILREYPTSSIRNHTAKIAGYNIWHDLLLAVGDSQISLNSIEHEVLRKMSEPRIHFAIVCASYSCPRLLNQAYTAENLEQQLRLNSKDFFANSENFRYDAKRQRFHMSSIMSWFAKDFGADKATQLAMIAPYLPTQDAYNAAVNNRVSISYLNYDWSLNETKVQNSRQSESNRR